MCITFRHRHCSQSSLIVMAEMRQENEQDDGDQKGQVPGVQWS
jgi:hypothetical protein